MKISEYRQQKHPEHLIAYLEHIEWGAGKHLAELLRRGAFTATYGESAKLHIAEADGKIIGFGAIIFLTNNPEFFKAVVKDGKTVYEMIGGTNMAAVHLAAAVGGNFLLGFISAVAFATIRR